MNLTWCRYTQYVELSPLEPQCGFNEERFSIFSEMIKRGHRIKILTPLTIPSEKLIKSVKAGEITHVEGLDCRWMAKLLYDPKGFPDKTDEVMFVECGPPNFMFDDKYVGGLQIRRCAEIYARFSGKLLIFSQNDPDLPMSLWKMACSKYGWSHPKNMYRIETKDNTYDEGKYNLKNYEGKEEYGWGDYDEMFRSGRKVVLLTKSVCPNKVAETYEGSRSMYATLVKKGLLHVEGIPTAYASEYVKDLQFNENPAYDVIYTGYCRMREKSFVELFTGLPESYKTAVTGPWNPVRIQMLDTSTECIGMIKGFINMPKMSNMSKSILQLATKKAKQYSWVTSRHLEAVYSGAICFYDVEYTCMEKYLGEDFALRSREDAIKKYRWIRRLSADARYKIWQYQWERCKNYNWVWWTDKFEAMCAKHGVKVSEPKHKFEKRQEIDISNLVSKM